jgi:hypothetical protein
VRARAARVAADDDAPDCGTSAGELAGAGRGASSSGMQLTHDACDLRGELRGLSERSAQRAAHLQALQQRTAAAARLMASVGLTDVGRGAAVQQRHARAAVRTTPDTGPDLAASVPADAPLPTDLALSSLAATLAERRHPGPSSRRPASARAAQRVSGATLAHAAAAAFAANRGGSGTGGDTALGAVGAGSGSARARASPLWTAAAAAAAHAIEDRRTDERMFSRLVRWSSVSSGNAGAGMAGANAGGGSSDLVALPMHGAAPHFPTAAEIVAAADALLDAVATTVPNAVAETCCVCLDEMGVGENVHMLGCGHRLHGPCLRRWLLGKASCVCPLCKREFGGPDGGAASDDS